MNGMRTTCPSCHAMFRVTPEQLAAHAGKVRCGKCAYVFNGFETLVNPIETVSLMAPVEDDTEVKLATPALGAEAINLRRSLSEADDGPTTAKEEGEFQRDAEEINREIAASAHPDLIKEVQQGAKPGLKVSSDLHEKLNDLQRHLSSEEKRSRWRNLGWGLGVGILVLALGLQAVYFYRDSLAASYPATKPALRKACELLHCKINLLANPDLIKLDATELQTLPDKPRFVILNASLRNLANYRLAYPNLELTLTDNANQAVARRQFAPQDYLPPSLQADAGMPAQDELPIKLSLELVNLDAVGYKLLIYYP